MIANSGAPIGISMQTWPLDSATPRNVALETSAIDAVPGPSDDRALFDQRSPIPAACPFARTVVSFVVKMNRESIRGPARLVANREFHHVADECEVVARRFKAHRAAARVVAWWSRFWRFLLFAALLPVAPAIAQTEVATLDLAIARPVMARHGMVVSQEAVASRVGVDILKRGGNAVDAAVAMGLTLAVTLPRAGNIGGGGFMLIHLAEGNKTVAIDYREMAPAQTTKDVFLNEKGEPDRNKSVFSGLAIGVPGTVAGLELAWRKYGAGRVSFADLVAPAARLAHQGLIVDDDLADSLPFATAAFARHPSSSRIYLRPDQTVPRAGDHIALDDLAATLDVIAARGAAGFYTGPVAEKIVAAVQEAGGRMTLEDLANYRAIEREPVRGTYRGHEIVSTPPPSSGGVHIIEIANILEGFTLGEQ